jgi:succinyl-diaminopimelate desuccinylase
MKFELKRILSSLVALETTSANSAALDEAFNLINHELKWYKFYKHVHLHGGIKSVVWSTVPGRHSSIILNAHIDVVPAKDSMYALQDVGNIWVGRGVMDMKFAIAAYVVALRQLYSATGTLPSLSIMITSDEEAGGRNGVAHLINDLKYSADVVLIPDGGSKWHLVNSSKGALHLRVKTVGKTSHASEPWGGCSAIDQMINSLAMLRTLYPIPTHQTQDTTVNIGTIQGGSQTNQVSNQAEATLDIRYPSNISSAAILKQISSVFGKNNMEILIQADPYICDLENEHVRSWIKLLKYYQKGEICINEYGASDGRYFSAKGIPTIVSQPIGGDTHGESEYIISDSVVDYTNTIVKWLKNIS